jgi:hypothetical protein
VLEASREMALSALSLPGELQRFMNRALHGDLELRVRDLDEHVRVLYSAGQQLLWGMLAAVSAVLAVVFDGRGQDRARLGAELGTGLFVALLFLSWMGGRPRRR